MKQLKTFSIKYLFEKINELLKHKYNGIYVVKDIETTKFTRDQ